MKDIVSINRNFLLLARDAAKDIAGPILTGVPKATLDRIGGLTMDQIDQLASCLPASGITFRFNDAEIDRMISGMKPANAPAYAMSLLTAPARA